jgi:hypothetical protein
MQYFNDHQIQLAIICSLASFAVTQIVKPFIKECTDKDKAAALVRLSAVLTGALCGFTLTYAVFDLWLGAGVGGINALIVRVLKERLKGQHNA